MHDERRKAHRHPVSMRIEFERGSGMTRDVSGLGVLFHTDALMLLGDEIDFSLILPVSSRIMCRGRVVRIAPDRPSGFAIGATIDRCLLPEESICGADPESRMVLQDLRFHHPDGAEFGE